jgi:hypothetical protein
MKIYKTEPRFNPKTGKPIKPERIWKETRCDFSGKVVESSEIQYFTTYYCMYYLDYNSQDACMGSGGDEYEFGQKYKVDMFIFLSEPYVIYNNTMPRESEEKKFLKALSKYESLDGALRDMRVKTAKKLIESGEISEDSLSEDSP